jgi:DNA polymerase III sliding clamp (beta) subunit (PCNA family)
MKIKIISKISEANYPNYKRFLNQKFRLKIGVNFKKLIDGIDRALIFLDEKNSKILNFELDIISKKIILTAQSDDKGMIHEIIEDVEFMYDDNIEYNKNNLDKIIININAYYLYEILRSIRSEKIIFGINDSMSPIALSDKNFQEKFYLLMPMSK